MRCISLYTGCGGLDLGFLQAGFQTVWANELSTAALETYSQELERSQGKVPEIVCGDITKALLPPENSAEIVIGGPPCQGFSVAGRMDPEDPRSRHVWEFFRIVEHISPEAFVMENVMALAVNARWKFVRDALQAHGERLGFQTRILLLNAADYGVPQLRHRMFLVGIKGKTMPTPRASSGKINVREALDDLPPFGEPGNDSKCNAIVTAAKSPVLRKSPFAGMLFNGQGRPINLDSPAPTLPASMGGNRTPIIDQESLERSIEPWVVGYHRQLLDGGPIVSSIPDRLRRLTVEEAARLQGFPVGMKFAGSQCAKFNQIGNSVPPPLAYAVAATLKSRLEKDGTFIENEAGQYSFIAEEVGRFNQVRSEKFVSA